MELNKRGCLQQGRLENASGEGGKHFTIHNCVSILNFLPVHMIYLKSQF